MKIDDARAYFDTEKELAQALGLRSQSAIGNWRRQGRDLLPELYARRLHEKTRGKLKFDPRLYGLK